MDSKVLKQELSRHLSISAKVFLINSIGRGLALYRGRPIARTRQERRLNSSAAVERLRNAQRAKNRHIVDHFDLWAERDHALHLATSIIDTVGIPFALLPQQNGSKTVVLREVDRAAVIRELSRRLQDGNLWLLTTRTCNMGKPKLSVSLDQRLTKRHLAQINDFSEFALFAHKVSAVGRSFGSPDSGVTLSFWHEVCDDITPRPDGYTYEPGTLLAPVPNGICAYLSPESWHAALNSPSRWPATASQPHIYQITDPIDVVYTWVDGDDPAWQQRKNEALSATDTAELNGTAVNPSRYISRNELMYSLRSIELYANWVRNIYIVTDHQIPEWLDTSNPRIKIVSHDDIFADPSILPVFNSHAIESQLHHIEGLSNRFLYLNDDVFFGGIAQPEDFYFSRTISKYFPSNAALDVAPPSSKDLPVLSAAKNARELIVDEFGVTITNKFKHTPIALQRDVLYEMEDRYADLFKAVTASKFRHPDDYSIPSGLYHFYAFETGRAVPGHIKYGYQDVSRENLPVFLARITQMNPYTVFCLNDLDSTPEQSMPLLRQITKTLEDCYPFRSEFEK